MKQVLERLGTVSGVLGSVFFDTDGMCVASHAVDAATESTLKNLGPLVASLLSADTGKHLADSQIAIFRYEGGSLVLRRAREYLLLVLCKPGTDLTSGGAGFHIAVACRLLGLHSSRIPPRSSRTMPAVRELEDVEPALKPARVPRI